MGRHKTTRWAVPIQGVFSSPPFFYDIEDNVDSKCGVFFMLFLGWLNSKFMYLCIYSWHNHFSLITYCISIAIIILELH